MAELKLRSIWDKAGNQAAMADYNKQLETEHLASPQYRLDQLYKKTSEAADAYKAQLPTFKQQAADQLYGDISADLDTGLKKTRKNYAQRGLLQSGSRVRDETGLQGQARNEYVSTLSEQNRAYDTQAERMRTGADAMKLGSYQDALKRAEELYSVNVENAVARRRAQSQLGAGIGYAGGLIANSYSKQPYVNNDMTGTRSGHFAPRQEDTSSGVGPFGGGGDQVVDRVTRGYTNDGRSYFRRGGF
jgi:hypothetical protein